jgi:hypothetical protein
MSRSFRIFYLSVLTFAIVFVNLFLVTNYNLNMLSRLKVASQVIEEQKTASVSVPDMKDYSNTKDLDKM